MDAHGHLLVSVGKPAGAQSNGVRVVAQGRVTCCQHYHTLCYHIADTNTGKAKAEIVCDCGEKILLTLHENRNNSVIG